MKECCKELSKLSVNELWEDTPKGNPIKIKELSGGDEGILRGNLNESWKGFLKQVRMKSRMESQERTQGES